MAQLYPRALGSLHVVSYDSQVYGGCILTLPQPGVPGPISVPQEQNGPVIPPGTGFPFRLFLRLAGLRWSYSNLKNSDEKYF
jgi:hypothetical protein